MHVTSATKSGCSVLFFSMNQDNNYNGIHRNAIHGFTLVGLKLFSQSMYIYVSCDMFGSTMGGEGESNRIKSNRNWSIKQMLIRLVNDISELIRGSQLYLLIN